MNSCHNGSITHYYLYNIKRAQAVSVIALAAWVDTNCSLVY